MTDASLHVVEKLFEYDATTGIIRWKESSGRARRGYIAGTNRGDGYLTIRIGQSMMLAHRVAWLLTHKELPAHLDHVNGVRNDNRIANLRPATVSENSQNIRKATARSTTGLLGVSLDKRRNRWRATIRINNVQKGLGYFDSKEEAHAAYLRAKASAHPFQTIVDPTAL